MKRIHKGAEIGDKDEAGKICGVAGGTYSYYTRRKNNPAPGPIDHRVPGSPALWYDLDAVRAWNDNRPGTGARSDLIGPPSKRTVKTPRRVPVPLRPDHIRALLEVIDPNGGSLDHAPVGVDWAALDQARSTLGAALRREDGDGEAQA